MTIPSNPQGRAEKPTASPQNHPQPTFDDVIDAPLLSAPDETPGKRMSGPRGEGGPSHCGTRGLALIGGVRRAPKTGVLTQIWHFYAQDTRATVPTRPI